MGHGEHAGAAMRRRERRLRAMLRHERMTVAMVLSEKKHHTSRGQNKDRTMGEENVMNCTAKLRKTPPPTAASTEDDPMVLDEGGALEGQHLCLRLLAGRNVCSGTAWSILPKSAPSCRFSMPMFLCRCWWISTLRSGTWKRTSWSPLIIWIAISRFLSWLSKYPRSASTSSLSAPWFLSRSWRNSWWKYRRSCHFPRFSGLWSRPWTFQFRRVVGDTQIFKVFSEERVQQVPSRSLTFPGGGLHRPGQSSSSADEPGKGVFRTFPQNKKVRSWARTRGRNCSPSRAHPRRLLSWRTPSSGCCSRTATLASLTAGTDVLSVLSGSRRLALRLCGSAKGMRREGSGTGTGIRVPPRLTSLLFLLSEELHRQPRAVYKYWVGGCSAS